MRMPWWALVVPLVAAAVMVLGLILHSNVGLTLICVPALVGAVMAAVHHAEVIAHRVGEPFGTLVLSVAITIIEVALIVSIVLAGGPEKSTLARDTIFAVIMITGNGLLGLSVLIGALRHHEQRFQIVGSNAALATLIALTTLSLVLPTFTISSSGPTYTLRQLVFTSTASLILWGTFVFVQTIRHREYFIPARGAGNEIPVARPSVRLALGSGAVLVIALISVVGLAEAISPAIEAAVIKTGAPKTVLSIAIAMLTLLPEASAAVRAALADRLQTSLNLSLGSALASIGLTIPAVALSSMILGVPIVLGLAPKELILLGLTFAVASITLVAGRTHILLGVVHLVIFASFIFFALVP